MFKAEDVKSSLLWLVHDREAEEVERCKKEKQRDNKGSVLVPMSRGHNPY